jgi:hypothetical protein
VEKLNQAKQVIVALKCAMTEASYPGNVGFAEMVQFYRKANDKQIDQMEIIIKNNDWTGFKNLIQKVLHINLQ